MYIDWFKAGKGPNPDLVSLDADMDAYFQKKSATDVTATTGAGVEVTTTTGAAVEAST